MPDLGPLWLSLALAGVTTAILLIIGTPLAWWLAGTSSRWKPVIEAVTALPLVLPPTVLGFYFLIVLGPASPVGAFWVRISGEALTFSFSGLVVASVVYSLPFMVQPLQNAFESVGRAPLEAAATLRAKPMGRVLLCCRAPVETRFRFCRCLVVCAHDRGVWCGAHGWWQYSGQDQGDFDRNLRARRNAQLFRGAYSVRRAACVRICRIVFCVCIQTWESGLCPLTAITPGSADTDQFSRFPPGRRRENWNCAA